MTTSANPEAWTIGRLLTWTTDYLAQREVDEPRLTAEVLLAHAAGCRRIELYTRFDEPLAADPLARFRSLVKRAADHEPFAYLVGEKEFYSLGFSVTQAVLIPRPETETLVETAVELCKSGALDAPALLDLGTGCGCVAVAIAKQLPDSRIVATDVSPEALDVARANTERHAVADRVRLVEADRLDLPADAVPDGGFDMLVSNPPYVPKGDMARLDLSVRAFEPTIALTDGADGLSFYKCIAEQAAPLLKPQSHILVEVGDDQAGAVVDVMTAGHEWATVSTMKDRVTRRERVIVFRRTP